MTSFSSWWKTAAEVEKVKFARPWGVEYLLVVCGLASDIIKTIE